MAKVNRVKEIEERRARNPEDRARQELEKRLVSIRQASEHIMAVEASGLRKELVRHLPVAVVAAMESYFQSVVRLFASRGGLYRERAAELAKDMKISLREMFDMPDRSITAADILAHELGFSSVQDFTVRLGILLNGKDLFKLLNDTLLDKGLEPVDEAEVMKALSRVFEDRHRFCHEFWVDGPVEVSEVVEAVHKVSEFLHRCALVVIILVDGKLGESQVEQCNRLWTSYEVSKAEMERIFEEALRQENEAMGILLRREQEAWLQVVELERTEIRASFEGGNGGGITLALRLKELMEDRIRRFRLIVRSVPPGTPHPPRPWW